ncbi:MAG: hypothetical protein JSW71_21790 [Gemmatimonadota bacterium]|nr:MAG: hypothetical protein JSW71_21790 [Gemmatimonadota bacterium]
MTMCDAALRRGAAVVLVALTGCARPSFPPVPPASPFAGGTLSQYDASLRHYLVSRDSAAVAAALRAGPKDSLLRTMQRGLVLRRFGEHERSNVALQEADRLARERYTKSISQNLAAFLVSDNSLDFYPSALEWSMVHFYGMLNYLELGHPESALVEARRANRLVQRYANDNPGRTYTIDAAVQYVAGMLQWSAGELNDAVVSLRQSLAAYERYDDAFGVPPPQPVAEDLVRFAGQLGLHDVATEVRQSYLDSPDDQYQSPDDQYQAPPGEDTGELLLLVEQGFVAHRAEQKLYIPILAAEKDSILHGDAESAIATAVLVLARTVVIMNELTRSGREFPRHEDGVIIATAGSAVGLELITLAWPKYELETFVPRDVRVAVDGGRACVPDLLQDLSAVAVRDFEERKTTVMLRMVARGLLKEAGITVAEAKGQEVAGDVGGFLARVASRAFATATERADTRTWSTLPGALSTVRSTLPAGPHVLEVSYVGLNGTERTETINVDVVPGRLAIASVHLVGSEPGDTQRLARARRGVVYVVPEQPARPGRMR